MEEPLVVANQLSTRPQLMALVLLVSAKPAVMDGESNELSEVELVPLPSFSSSLSLSLSLSLSSLSRFQCLSCPGLVYKQTRD